MNLQAPSPLEWVDYSFVCFPLALSPLQVLFPLKGRVDNFFASVYLILCYTVVFFVLFFPSNFFPFWIWCLFLLGAISSRHSPFAKMVKSSSTLQQSSA